MNQQLKPVMDEIFEKGPPPRLQGGSCPACGRQFFPRPLVCPICLGATSPTYLASEGTLHSFAIVRTRPPFGLPEPYAVGYVDLDDCGLRIISLLDPDKTGELAIDQRVALKVGPLGVNRSGEPCMRYFFSPSR